jgi:hypothetical protein
VSFPSPPWELRGQIWRSLFYAAPPGAPRGSYVAAYLELEAGSTVPHRALLLARREREGGHRRVTAIDGWADSPEAVEGSRALWGLQVSPGELTLDAGGLGPVRRAAWSASTDGQPVASAQFADTSGVMVRAPLRTSVANARLRGTGRTVPSLASWEIEPGGPLGWLAGSQPVVSFRVRDARLRLE